MFSINYLSSYFSYEKPSVNSSDFIPDFSDSMKIIAIAEEAEKVATCLLRIGVPIIKDNLDQAHKKLALSKVNDLKGELNPATYLGPNGEKIGFEKFQEEMGEIIEVLNFYNLNFKKTKMVLRSINSCKQAILDDLQFQMKLARYMRFDREVTKSFDLSIPNQKLLLDCLNCVLQLSATNKSILQALANETNKQDLKVAEEGFDALKKIHELQGRVSVLKQEYALLSSEINNIENWKKAFYKKSLQNLRNGTC